MNNRRPPVAADARRADIQGLRAIAVLIVVGFHAALPMPGGFVGVDVFFVVSGYVITAMLNREWQRSGKIRVGNFYSRRFKRLAPALGLMTAVTMLISAAVLSPLGPQQTAGKTGIGATVLAANVVIARSTGAYFDAAADTNPLLHTWSLSVEEQFYLAFPALIMLGLTFARRRGWRSFTFAALAVGTGASFALAVAVNSRGWSIPGADSVLGFYDPITRAWEFGVGALLALVPVQRLSRSTRGLSVLGLLGFAAVLASVAMINDRTPFPGPATLLPVTGTLLLLLAGRNAAAPTSRVLASRPMVRIGDWSYSIYLWHWPFIVFAGLLWQPSAAILSAAALLSLVPAILSYYWVEQPIRNLQWLSPRRWMRLTVAVIVPPLILGSALWAGASQGWWSQPIRQFQAETIPAHVGNQNHCDSRRPLRPVTAQQCGWNLDGTGKPIYLLGDSNAGHFAEGFIQAGRDLRRPVLVATASACPMIDLVFRTSRPQSRNAPCGKYVGGTLSFLKTAKPGLVVLSTTDSYWYRDDMKFGTTPDDLSNNPTTKIALFETGLQRTVETITGAGHQVMLIGPTPKWDGLWDPERCAPISIARGDCTAHQTLAEAVGGVHAAPRAVLAAVAQRTGAKLWDSAVALCPDGTCSTAGPGFLRYRDKTHLSVAQSIALAPTLRAFIESIGD